MNILLSAIHENGHNVRRHAASAEEQAALEISIRELGVLQPILVRPDPDLPLRYLIIAGHRRVAAARAIGLAEIPAELREDMPDPIAMAAQMAENSVRVAMSPLDQWRAVRGLLESGYSITAAGQALGLSERRVQQLNKLGSLHKDVIAAIEKTGTMPGNRELAIIASAPAATQARAIKAKDAMAGKNQVLWWKVGELCNATAIPKARAIFDIEAAGDLFEEDLFAEPGSNMQFVTHDVARFLKLQRGAIAERIAAGKAKKEDIRAEPMPANWTEVHTPPKKLKPGMVRFLTLSESGWAIGSVDERVGTPAAARPKPGRQQKADATDDDTPTAPQPVPSDAPGITKKGQELIAKAKTEALRAHLRQQGARIEPSVLTMCLALLFSADNVTAQGGDFHTTWAGSSKNGDLARRMVNEAGQLQSDLADEEWHTLAAEIIARALVVKAPGQTSTYAPGSGLAAEWIGNAIGADATLPRFDTEEFLACCGGDVLRRVAEEVGITGVKKISDLRARLVGNAPDWRPTTFGAPGPLPADDPKDDSDG